MNIDYTYLNKLGKDELIELLLLINSETIKSKKQILQEAVAKDGVIKNDRYIITYVWVRICDNVDCLTLVNMDGGIGNFGFECYECNKVYCSKCPQLHSCGCTRCDTMFCKHCIDPTLLERTNVCHICKHETLVKEY